MFGSCSGFQSRWWTFFTCLIAVLVPQVMTQFSRHSLEPLKTVSLSDFPHSSMKDDKVFTSGAESEGNGVILGSNPS